MSFSYIIIPVITLIVSYLASGYVPTDRVWYYTLNKPWFNPPAWIFAPVWSVIYVLTAACAMIVWMTFERTTAFWWIIVLFAINAVLNVSWCAIFFTHRMIGAGFIVALALAATVYMLMALIMQQSWKTALLLVPYAAWITFACVLNYQIWLLN